MLVNKIIYIYILNLAFTWSAIYSQQLKIFTREAEIKITVRY